MDKPTALYVDLMKRTLTGMIYEDPPNRALFDGSLDEAYDEDTRANGEDWPSTAYTMVGLKRLSNLQLCIERVLADGVPGDFIETGVWRGGACIFARALFNVYGADDRLVWVADSFEGMPVAGERSHPIDHQIALHRFNQALAIPLEQVRTNFRRCGLPEDNVRFLPGWFCDSLPNAPVERLAVLRLDGDLYESTMDALENLYPKLSAGGYAIIDDYGIVTCREAVHKYRADHGITDEMITIDNFGVYWRRTV